MNTRIRVYVYLNSNMVHIYTCKYVEGIFVYHFGPLLMGAQVIHTTAIDIYLHQATLMWLFACTVIPF